MKFSEEMKMMLQLQHLSRQKKTDVTAVQEDYERLLQQILSDLKNQIRHDLISEKFAAVIEGDFLLSPNPSVRCTKIPTLGDEPKMYFYRTAGNLHTFHWGPLCLGKYDGKRMASKNVLVELTAAGEKLLPDLSALAAEDGIQITCQPALNTKAGSVVLPAFGRFEKVTNPKHDKDGRLLEYCVNIHYLIE